MARRPHCRRAADALDDADAEEVPRAQLAVVDGATESRRAGEATGETRAAAAARHGAHDENLVRRPLVGRPFTGADPVGASSTEQRARATGAAGVVAARRCTHLCSLLQERRRRHLRQCTGRFGRVVQRREAAAAAAVVAGEAARSNDAALPAVSSAAVELVDAAIAAGEEAKVEEVTIAALLVLHGELHQVMERRRLAVEQRALAGLRLAVLRAEVLSGSMMGGAIGEVERGGRRSLRAEHGGARRRGHEVIKLRGAIAAAAEAEDIAGRRRRLAGLIREAGGKLRGGHAGEPKCHVAGATVYAGADGRHARVLLRQRVAEGAVGDEAVPPAYFDPICEEHKCIKLFHGMHCACVK